MRWFASIRVRTTVSAVVIVALSLALGGVGLVVLLRHALVDNAESEARLRAEDAVALVKAGGSIDDLRGSVEDAAVVQVVDESGAVVGQSPGIRGDAPLLDARPEPGASVAATVDHPPVGDGPPYRVVAIGVDGPSGPMVVYAAGSLESTGESVHAVTVLLAIGLPLLVVLVGGTTWWVVGRTLEPVEAIRREVAAISTAALDRRVPEPAVADEIGRLARTMNEMLERLETASRRERAFVSDASHELRSPLATMRTQLEVALAHPDRADYTVVLGRLQVQQARVERLVEDLLVLARADEGAAPRQRLVDLDELVLRELEPLRASQRVRVELARLDAGRVIGDPDQLGRVVRNLVDNAERHAATEVGISLASRNGTVELLVHDDGPGIAVEDRERIFERFSRLDDARSRDEGGAGLGLAIVREVVTAHQGTVEVIDGEDHDRGRGATFRVRLPAATVSAPSTN